MPFAATRVYPWLHAVKRHIAQIWGATMTQSDLTKPLGNSASEHVASNAMRDIFSKKMSAMYRDEVPQYGTLLDIVKDVNDAVLSSNKTLMQSLQRTNELGRLSLEYHGAIRLGTPTELSMVRRVFAVLGMYPVGYYDLSVAGVPVHSTAFRPVGAQALSANPFRVFTSLLRLDLIDDLTLRQEAKAILSQRNIFSPELVALTEKAERESGLGRLDSEIFVGEVVEIFRWHSDAVVDAQTYQKLHDAHRLLADVVCFKGPHINHLTPRTLDIDAAQVEMPRRGVDAKQIVEGPPRRKTPILLRQTSFKALEEKIRFVDDTLGEGKHTARFGEIEQRGIALTPKGMALYDQLLSKARAHRADQGTTYEANLVEVFQAFPDDLNVLRQDKLAYFKYTWIDSQKARRLSTEDSSMLESLITEGVIVADAILYEDFLPVSAAGIFQSNLGGVAQEAYAANHAKADFEAALGVEVYDYFELYASIETESLAQVYAGNAN